jgi:hypothetical protein
MEEPPTPVKICGWQANESFGSVRISPAKNNYPTAALAMVAGFEDCCGSFAKPPHNRNIDVLN